MPARHIFFAILVLIVTSHVHAQQDDPLNQHLHWLGDLHYFSDDVNRWRRDQQLNRSHEGTEEARREQSEVVAELIPLLSEDDITRLKLIDLSPTELITELINLDGTLRTSGLLSRKTLVADMQTAARLNSFHEIDSLREDHLLRLSLASIFVRVPLPNDLSAKQRRFAESLTDHDRWLLEHFEVSVADFINACCELAGDGAAEGEFPRHLVRRLYLFSLEHGFKPVPGQSFDSLHLVMKDCFLQYPKLSEEDLTLLHSIAVNPEDFLDLCNRKDFEPTSGVVANLKKASKQYTGSDMFDYSRVNWLKNFPGISDPSSLSHLATAIEASQNFTPEVLERHGVEVFFAADGALHNASRMDDLASDPISPNVLGSALVTLHRKWIKRNDGDALNTRGDVVRSSSHRRTHLEAGLKDLLGQISRWIDQQQSSFIAFCDKASELFQQYGFA